MPVALPKPPSTATLRSYGLTAADWYAMCRRQGGFCPVCRKPFGDRKLVVDHDHVRGFRATKRRKSKDARGRSKEDKVRLRVMTPAERRPHVRGVLHAWCNGLVRVWLTLERAESIRDYLEAHRARRQAEV